MRAAREVSARRGRPLRRRVLPARRSDAGEPRLLRRRAAGARTGVRVLPSRLGRSRAQRPRRDRTRAPKAAASTMRRAAAHAGDQRQRHAAVPGDGLPGRAAADPGARADGRLAAGAGAAAVLDLAAGADRVLGGGAAEGRHGQQPAAEARADRRAADADLQPHRRAGGDDPRAAAVHDPAAVHRPEGHPAAVHARRREPRARRRRRLRARAPAARRARRGRGFADGLHPALGYYITPALVGGGADQMLSYFVATYTTDTGNWGSPPRSAC